MRHRPAPGNSNENRDVGEPVSTGGTAQRLRDHAGQSAGDPLAIKEHPGTGVVTNRLRVNASADSLRVFVNDSSVARVALGSAGSSGHFGFRVGKSVNLHLTILDHIRHLAPARTR